MPGLDLVCGLKALKVESLLVHQSKGRLLGLPANFKNSWKNFPITITKAYYQCQ